MELNTILIILGVIALIVLVVHGIWANKREKSTFFKNTNSFVDDSRVEQDKKEKVHINTAQNISKTYSANNKLSSEITEKTSVVSQQNTKIDNSVNVMSNKVKPVETLQDVVIPNSEKVLSEDLDKEISSSFVDSRKEKASEPEIIVDMTPMPEKINTEIEYSTIEDNLSVEEAVEKIKIHVPKSNKTKNLAELSIAELEASIEDEEEGFNTHSPQVREQLANLSSHKVDFKTVNTAQNNTEQNEIKSNMAIKVQPKEKVENELDVKVEKKPETKPETKPVKETVKEKPQDTDTDKVNKPKVMMLYIVAQEGKDFTGEDLEICFEKEGFLFGDKEIYHRHADLSSASPVLFSVANVQNPGIFDPKAMENFATFGIVLFMQIPSAYGQDLTNLRLMISTAKAMAKELDGSLLTDQQKPFDQVAENEYLNKVK